MDRIDKRDGLEEHPILLLGANRSMEEINNPAGRTPELNGAVVLIFPHVVSMDALFEFLPCIEEWRSIEEGIEIVYRSITSFSGWHMEDLLAELLSLCDTSQILHTINEFNGEVLIDLWFYHYDSYPSLYFGGRNMEIIRNLHANISIDPY